MLVFVFIPKNYSYDDYYKQNTFSYKLFERLTALLIYVILYFFSEIIFKSRTIGKFITGTKAVNETGSKISARTALLRSLSRAVPFEAFSAFGSHPWHDKWTKTFVIDVRKTALNNPDFNQ